MWKYVNETVEAVKTGLLVGPDDRVLAVCSAGVLPLAILEDVTGSGNVVAVDINPEQFGFAQHLARLIVNGDYQAIEALDPCPKSPGYFLQTGRLEAIARNLPRLSYLQHDLTQEPITDQTYTRGYFSNVMEGLFHMGSAFQKGAIIYVSHHTASIEQDPQRVVRMYSTFYNWDIDSVFDVDIDRTLAANAVERTTDYINKSKLHGELNDVWRPIVYRKR